MFPLLLALLAPAAQGAPAPRPNVVIVLADDLGWSDLGCFGGEIETPHLDALAANGLRMTQLYDCGRCCPTRASLLTGLYPHQAGIGHMTCEGTAQADDKGLPGYRGSLSPATATIAEVARGAGYRTLMSGKWHVGTFEGDWPLDRGFERFFGILRGACNYWRPAPDKLLMRDRTPVEPPEDFYATDAFTDAALEMLQAVEQDDETPFLLYLAYTAPHWPLHAHPEVVARYRGRYRDGWDAVRAARFARQRELGIAAEGWALTPRDGPDWSRLDEAQRDELDHRMALYAAQVHELDANVGRLVAKLRALGELDDTLLVFLSDNGACAEGGDLGGGPADLLSTERGYWLTCGKGWANASNTPLRRFKHWVHEGGIASPGILHWPRGLARPGRIARDPAHVVDLMATLVELAGARYPARRAGRDVPPPEGTSLVPVLRGEALAERTLFWEHEGNVAVRRGRHKLVAAQGADWELYDLAADRCETSDLALDEPELAAALSAAWSGWAERCGVLPFPPRRRAGWRPPQRDYPATWVDLAGEDGERSPR